MQVLIEYLTDDIESSGRSIDTEHKRLTSGQQKHEADEVEPYVTCSQTTAHDGVAHLLQHLARSAKHIRIPVCVQHGLTGLQLRQHIGVVDHLMGKVGIRIETVPYLNQRTQDHRRIDGLGAELIAYQDKCHNEQEGIDTHHQIREHVRITADERIDHDRETGDGTNNQMARHQEIIYCCCTETHSGGHHQQFFPKLHCLHGLPEGNRQVAPIRAREIHFKVFHVIKVVSISNFQTRPILPCAELSGSAGWSCRLWHDPGSQVLCHGW